MSPIVPLRFRITRIVDYTKGLSRLTDSDLLERAKAIRWEMKSGVSSRARQDECLSLAIEACRRSMGIFHFPVQILGALNLLNGRVIEMQTGEGKTATAVLPAAVRAMVGRGCHVVTSNDYLAKRDAEILRPAYQLLGLTVGCIQSEMSEDDRRLAYACDITYSTAVQLGFDFLRDRLRLETAHCLTDDGLSGLSRAGCVQRGHYFALIDEADNVLIDEAGTPLVIGSSSEPEPGENERLVWARDYLTQMKENEDFLLHVQKRNVWLTEAGCRKVCLAAKPPAFQGTGIEKLYRYVEQALLARDFFHRDTHYLVNDEGEVTIIDEGTGRSLPGRRWQDGLHQAVETKEGQAVSPVGGTTARITIQTFFRRYNLLAGMTGTCSSAKSEFRTVYKLRLRRIPTNRKCIRSAQRHQIFATRIAKWRAVVEDTTAQISLGRAVLIGTCSVNASEELSALMEQLGIQHVVLNARRNADEAKIVAKAGTSRTITIATNMAGRGTDIPLDDACRNAGGLHVIATEMHSSKRIDRQLVGRAARQGDPGSYRFILSMEDELLRAVPNRVVASWLRKYPPDLETGEITSRCLRLFQATQNRLEATSLRYRKSALKNEQFRIKTCRKMGIEHTLEMIED